MKKLTLSLVISLMCFASSVSFAGVHSPPASEEPTIKDAVVNFETPVTFNVVAVKEEIYLTPVLENIRAMYTDSRAKEVITPVAVDEVIIGDQNRKIVSEYNSYKRSTDYELTGIQ